MGKVLWGITGAGHWIRESVELLKKVSEKHRVTVVMTRSGAAIAKLYGVWDIIKSVTGGYYRELEVDPNPLSHTYGRVMMKRYDVVVVAPATANTVAKVVNGIADNLVTSVIAMARKSGVKTLMMPTDAPWVKKTTLPCVIEGCEGCDICPPQEICPTNAIDGSRVKRILLSRCIGCELCVGACPFSAISCFKEVKIEPHWLDIKNTEKLSEIGIEIAKDPQDLKEKLEVMLG